MVLMLRILKSVQIDSSPCLPDGPITNESMILSSV